MNAPVAAVRVGGSSINRGLFAMDINVSVATSATGPGFQIIRTILNFAQNRRGAGWRPPMTDASAGREPPTEPYRPSNGTEGEIFMHNWCERCTRDAAHRRNADAPGCKIIAYMMAFDIDDPEYPKQIVRTAGVPWGEGNPRCTSFREVGTRRSATELAAIKQRSVDRLPLFQRAKDAG